MEKPRSEIGSWHPERGQALLEFTLVLPFLLLLLVGILDAGLMINEYMSLTSIAQAGLRLAEQTTDLEIESLPLRPNLASAFVSAAGAPECALILLPPYDDPVLAGTVAKQRQVHERVSRVICLLERRGQMRFLRRQPHPTVVGETTLDLRMTVDRKPADPLNILSNQDSVTLRVWSWYNGFLPFFNGIQITVSATAPYLY